jgi:ribosomal protein S8
MTTGENSKETTPLSEPIYEVVKDRKIKAAITQWLKSAGFEKGTSYIPTQSNKNELIIQITKFEWKRIGNIWNISLKVWVDFINKNEETIITQEWVNKMRDNYSAIRNLSQQKVAIVSWTVDLLDNMQDEFTA